MSFYSKEGLVKKKAKAIETKARKKIMLPERITKRPKLEVLRIAPIPPNKKAAAMAKDRILTLGSLMPERMNMIAVGIEKIRTNMVNS